MDTVPPALSGVRSAQTFLHQKAFINGQWVEARSGTTFEVFNPSTGGRIGLVPDMTSDDTEAAIEAAHTAFHSWRNVVPKERGSILRRWFDLVLQNKEELAKLMTAENGKPYKEALSEMAYGASFIEWYAEEARRLYGDVIPATTSSKRIIVIKQPIGVAGLITPWNFPNAMITRKACAAIAVGCTVVLKPAEDTPYSALALCQLAKEAGLPDGVLNVVTCSRQNAPTVGKTLCESPLVAALSFTGSTTVGKVLLKQCADTVKKVSLELGGNAPFLVFDSADVEAAARNAIIAKFRFSGQTCICANRILVQAGIYNRFVQRLTELMLQELKVGDGFEADTTQGPLINAAALAKVSGIVKDSVQSGARAVLGGKPHSKGRHFYEPTLLVDVNEDMRCAREEIFGPVAAILKFESEEEALALSNASRSGLAGYFFSRDLAQVWRVAERLEVGMVGVNEGLISTPEAPFGGVKESGLGREGSKYGVDEFTEIKYICIGGI